MTGQLTKTVRDTLNGMDAAPFSGMDAGQTVIQSILKHTRNPKSLLEMIG